MPKILSPSGDVLSPWHPITNPLALKVLGKYLEELGENVAATARCVIQGVDESEPPTGKPNREWLLEEIADVLANAEMVVEYLELDHHLIEARITRKKANLRAWHEGLEVK